jgi:hypothetical protein
MAEAVGYKPAFAQLTRRNRVPLPDMAFTSAGSSQRADLPQVGYLAGLWITAFGNINSGASAAGTFNANYFPYNLFSRIRLSSNEGLEIYNTDGYANLLVMMSRHMGYQPAQLTAANNFGIGTQGSRLCSIFYPTGTIAASTTYPFLVNYFIPVASDDDLRAGLILLQNQATRASLEMTLGTFSDWGFTAFANATISCTVRASMEFYSVPADPAAQPDTTFIHRVIQEQVPLTTLGEQVYRVPVNGVIIRVFQIMLNNAAPFAFFTTANNPTTPAIGNIQVQYAASQKPEIEDFRTYVARNRYFYGQDYPDGVILHEFGLGGGSVEVGTHGRDLYDTSQLTEFSLITNVTAGTLTNANIRYVREELQRRS